MIRELEVQEAMEVVGGWTDAEGHTYSNVSDGSVMKSYWIGGWGITAQSANLSGSGSVSTSGKASIEGSFKFEFVGLQIQTPELVNIKMSASEAAYSSYRAGERASYPR